MPQRGVFAEKVAQLDKMPLKLTQQNLSYVVNVRQGSVPDRVS